MTDIILVGCVAQKQDRPAAARDLYTSPLFRKRRAYAEASGKPWFILSAQHGILRPAEVVPPYDFTIDRLTTRERRLWALRVAVRRGVHEAAARAAGGGGVHDADADEGAADRRAARLVREGGAVTLMPDLRALADRQPDDVRAAMQELIEEAVDAVMALRRIASTESFTCSLDLRPRGSERQAIVDELHARMRFAKETVDRFEDRR